MTNKDDIRAWTWGSVASTANLSTNGNQLYSYQLLIGFTTDRGEKVILDYTAESNNSRSSTTSTHIGYAKRTSGVRIKCPSLEHEPMIRDHYSDYIKHMKKTKGL